SGNGPSRNASGRIRDGDCGDWNAFAARDHQLRMDHRWIAGGLDDGLGDGCLGADDGDAATDRALPRVWRFCRLASGRFRILSAWGEARWIPNERSRIRGAARVVDNHWEPGGVCEIAGPGARHSVDLQRAEYFQSLPARGNDRLFHSAPLLPGNGDSVLPDAGAGFR